MSIICHKKYVLPGNILLIRNYCCVYNGTMIPVYTHVDYFSPDYGCTYVNIFKKTCLAVFFTLNHQVSMVCEMCPGGPCVSPHVDFSCFSVTWPQYPATVSGPHYNGTYNGTEYKKPMNKKPMKKSKSLD